MNITFGKRVLLVALVMVVFQHFFEINREWLMAVGNDFVNTSDHKFYSERIFGDFNLQVVSLGELNNFPLTLLYGGLARLTHLRIDQYAYIVNIPILLFAYIVIERIHIIATGTVIRPIYVFGLLPLLAYVPLINKDAFGVLFYPLLALVFLRPRITDAIFIAVLLPLRIQHILVLIISLFFRIPSITFPLRVGILVVLYIILSTAAGYVSSSDLIFNAADVTGSATGLGYLVRSLNNYGYLGSVLFNLTVPLKYIFDLGRSVQTNYSVVGITIMIGRIGTTALLVLNARRLIPLIYCPPYFCERRQLYCISSVVCSFFLAWMVSPIVHYRYLLNVVPLLMAGLSILSIEHQVCVEPSEDEAIVAP
jgi:hypothetical protein